jgi:hypothetical protein
MKFLWTVLPLVLFALVVPCRAENNPNSKTTIAISPGEVTPTQDMWFYEQYQKQYSDPKAAVRQQAEFRSMERMRRISAIRWYGFSNQRPAAGCDPIHNDYAPRWTSNNTNLPNEWNGPTTTTILVKPTAAPSRSY